MAIQVKERAVAAHATPRKKAARLLGMSVAELIAATVVVLFCIFAFAYFMTAISPLRSELSLQQKQLDTLKQTEKELLTASRKPPEAPVDAGKEALASLETFKSSRLRPLSVGRIALINDLNALAKKHSVQLTTGIDMSMDRAEAQLAGDKKGTKVVKKDSNLQSVFPNLKIRFTVAGDYAKLRGFISDLEANKQFITIEALNIQTIRESEGGGRKGRQAVVSGISLAIELTAYFYPQNGN
ncbi:MAG: hypothetical protein HY231_10160 [Acidobacteria bacterium]|nr:hypothetical protein [Acidobacteriota bacterium]